jgi:predicted GTPase
MKSVQSKRYTIGFVGRVSSGKSSIINGIMGEFVAGVALLRSTIIPTSYASWNAKEIPPTFAMQQELLANMTSSHSAARLHTPIQAKYTPFNSTHICVIDLPGFDDASGGKSDGFLQLAIEYIKQIDVVVFVTQAKSAMILKSEVDAFDLIKKKISKYIARGIWKDLVVIANEYDYEDKEVDEVINAANKKVIGGVLSTDRIYPFSAWNLCKHRIHKIAADSPDWMKREWNKFQRAGVANWHQWEVEVYNKLRDYDAEQCKYTTMMNYWDTFKLSNETSMNEQYHDFIDLLLYINTNMRNNSYMGTYDLLHRLCAASSLHDCEKIIITQYLTREKISDCVNMLSSNGLFTNPIYNLLAQKPVEYVAKILAEKWGAYFVPIDVNAAYIKLDPGGGVIENKPEVKKVQVIPQRIIQQIYEENGSNKSIPAEMFKDIYGKYGGSVNILSCASLHLPRLAALSMMKYCEIIARTYVDKLAYMSYFTEYDAGRAVDLNNIFLKHCAEMYFVEGRHGRTSLDAIGEELFKILTKLG